MENVKTTKRILETCCICRAAAAKNEFWVFRWEGRSGYACEKCSERWYTIGEFLICKAVDAMTENGIKHITWKDKYGRWEISAYGITSERQVVFMQNLLVLYRKLYPEFTWDW